MAIAQSLMGKHLRGALPAIKEFYQVKREYIMERKQQELVAAKRVRHMQEKFYRGSKDLPKLVVGDSVRFQNQTTVRPTMWDKTGIITAILSTRKYEVMMDGSCRNTTRNMRITGKELEVEKEEDDMEKQLPVPSVPAPAPVPAPVPVEVHPEGPTPVSVIRKKL